VPNHRAPRRRIKGFFILMGSLAGMFLALIVGSVLVLAGLAVGIIGLILVIIYLLSIMVFFWELVISTDDHQSDAPRPKPPVEEWITPDEWVAEHIHRWERNKGLTLAETETKPERIVPGRLG
jgi:hypothetical protein